MQDDVTAAREIAERAALNAGLIPLQHGSLTDQLMGDAILLAIHKTREQCAAVAMETQYGSFAAAAIRAMGK